MLVTNTPIPGLPKQERARPDVTRHVEEMGMAGALARLPQFETAHRLGDATDVLLSLGDIVGEPIAQSGV